MKACRGKKGLGGRQSRSGDFRRTQKSFAPAENRTAVSRFSIPWPAAVPTGLSRFPARIKVDPSVVCFVLRSR
jgi:hypothetical protein